MFRSLQIPQICSALIPLAAVDQRQTFIEGTSGEAEIFSDGFESVNATSWSIR